jgi:hypothetical protein
MRRVSDMRSGRPEQTASQSVAGNPASGMSRRTMMKTVGLGTAALAVPGLVAGCSSSSGGATRIVFEETKTLRFWSDRGVDGFRVDVAHGLAKNLAEPLASLPVGGNITDGSLPPGTHPLWDRDEVHDIYAEWRQVFNEYDPPRAGVAEAWVHPSRRPKYASPDGWDRPSTSTCSKRTGAPENSCASSPTTSQMHSGKDRP